MEADFWHKKWAEGDIGFHEGQPNALLVQYLPALALPQGARIFLPLCGKTRDIAWLLQAGFRVVGAELSELAVTALFTELGITPDIVSHGELQHFQARNIDIFVGDVFHLSAEALGGVDATYDRAALVAMAPGMRERYAAHVMTITAVAPQLVITFDYDQSIMNGPPFAVNANLMQTLFGEKYHVESLGSRVPEGGLKGQLAVTEIAWFLAQNSLG